MMYQLITVKSEIQVSVLFGEIWTFCKGKWRH